MKINRHNYEQYFVDLADGNLSEAEALEVNAFLLANPDLASDYESFKNCKLNDAPIHLANKSFLRDIPLSHVSVDSHFFKELCIQQIEGLNADDEQELLNRLVLYNQSMKTFYEQLKLTKLTKIELVFNEKILHKKGNYTHSINHNNFEEYCVAYTEGWLDQSGKMHFEDYISNNSSKASLFQTFQKLKLTPDYTVRFENKNQLKKLSFFGAEATKRLAAVASVAAMVILSILVVQLVRINKSDLVSEVSIVEIIDNVNEIRVIQPNLVESQELDYASNLIANNSPMENKENEAVPEFNVRSISAIEPIKSIKLECLKCTVDAENGLYFNKKMNDVNAVVALESKIEKEPLNDNALAWKLAQAGIVSINKLSNAELVLKKQPLSGKTKIAFNSKRFSFSTAIKKKTTLKPF